MVVCILLAVAVVVVLFGSSTVDKPVGTLELVAQLEADSGERQMGLMLLPRAKEAWQAAQELAQRLEERDKYLKPEEIEPVAERLVSILGQFEPGRSVSEPAPAKQYFVMMALGRLGSAQGVEPLAAWLTDDNAWTRATALKALAEMGGVAEAGGIVPKVLPLLSDPEAQVRIVACATLAGLATPGDAATIRALCEQLEGDREVQWNAAMALARLGSGRGKLMLMNMLDRGYWEGMELTYEEPGALIRRGYGQAEVERNLTAAIDAAARLNDAELGALIAGLANDRSVTVRQAARAAVRRSASMAQETPVSLSEPVAIGEAS